MLSRKSLRSRSPSSSRNHDTTIGVHEQAPHKSQSTLPCKWNVIFPDSKSTSGLRGCVIAACKNLQYISVSDKAGLDGLKYVDRSILFCDKGHVEPITISRLGAEQKINRFNDISLSAGDKCGLFQTLNNMRTLFPDDYDFFPPTWQFPEDLLNGRFHQMTGTDAKYYLLKPSRGSQGKGIRLARQSEVANTFARMCGEGLTVLNVMFPSTVESEQQDSKRSIRSSAGRASTAEKSINSRQSATNPDITRKVCVQECVEPFLLSARKFDLRIYVLVTSVNPLRVHLSRSNMLRLCSEAYVPPTMESKMNKFSILTNTSINMKYQHEFHDDGCCKRSLQEAIPDLEKQVFPSESHFGFRRNLICANKQGLDWRMVWSEIKRIVSLSLTALQPRLAVNYDSCCRGASAKERDKCFQLLGFDILISSVGKPYLLEINTSPSMELETPQDRVIKLPVIAGALDILCVAGKLEDDGCDQVGAFDSKPDKKDGGVKSLEEGPYEPVDIPSRDEPYVFFCSSLHKIFTSLLKMEEQTFPCKKARTSVPIEAKPIVIEFFTSETMKASQQKNPDQLPTISPSRSTESSLGSAHALSPGPGRRRRVGGDRADGRSRSVDHSTSQQRLGPRKDIRLNRSLASVDESFGYHQTSSECCMSGDNNLKGDMEKCEIYRPHDAMLPRISGKCPEVQSQQPCMSSDLTPSSLSMDCIPDTKAQDVLCPSISPTVLSAVGIAILRRVLEILGIPVLAFQDVFLLTRSSLKSQINFEPAKADCRALKGLFHETSLGTAIKSLRGKSLAFDAFREGLIRMAGNIADLAEEADDDSETIQLPNIPFSDPSKAPSASGGSRSESSLRATRDIHSSETVDILEGILTGLEEVLESGRLPSQIEELMGKQS